MKTIPLLATIGLLAAGIGSPALADLRGTGAAATTAALVFVHDTGRDSRRDRDRARQHKPGYERGMRVVAVAAGPGEPGDGWRYYTHPAAARAVVISPQGEYFFSRGDGLSLVAVAVAPPRS